LKVGLRVFMLIAAAVFGVAIAHGDTLDAGRIELVRFQSGSYTDFRQVFMREAATAAVTVSATLSFPNETRDRYPAVVVVHTIAGYQESNEGWHAAELRKAGFATLTYDSFAARGLSEAAIIASSAGPPWASAVADAYAALRLLASHPKIDAGRIAIVGFSFGGEIAHLTAFERLRTALVPGRLRYAAHVAYYPAGVYGAAAEQGAYTGAPILMLLGENDDNLPVAKAEGYLGYSRGAGYSPPIEVLIYPGAYHAWTIPSLRTLRFYPQYGSTRKCPFVLFGPTGPALLVGGQEKPLDVDSLRTCMDEGRGYSMVYDPSVRVRSTDDAVAFLLKHLRS
jgi:dienelactone hydrolase